MARTLTQPGSDRQNRMIFMGAIALAALAAVLVFASLSNFGGGSGSSSDRSGCGNSVRRFHEFHDVIKLYDVQLFECVDHCLLFFGERTCGVCHDRKGKKEVVGEEKI
mgnify:CR=1 FL=1